MNVVSRRIPTLSCQVRPPTLFLAFCCSSPSRLGSSDGRICIWDITPPQGQEKWEAPAQPQPGRAVIASPTLQPIQVLNENKGGGPTRVLRFSPKFSMFTSGGNDVVSPFLARSIQRSAFMSDPITCCARRFYGYRQGRRQRTTMKMTWISTCRRCHAMIF